MAQRQLSAAEQNMMRQDAQRRHREMRRGELRPVPLPPPKPKEEPKPEPPPKQQNPHIAENPLESILSKLDSDKMLLLALLYVLWREGGDIQLIIALAYVLL